MTDAPTSDAYSKAGVNIDEANRAVRSIGDLIASTRTPRVQSELGVFAGFFAYPDETSERLLVTSMDGVGTKLKLSAQSGRWTDAGFDIVSHCTSDILVHGARPLFFLDYIGAGKLEVPMVHALVAGMSEACRLAGCALIGGETAEMPGVYGEGDCDVVGTVIGEVLRSHLVDGKRIESGDVLIGLPSIGLHTNGYSLARSILGTDSRPDVLGECPGDDGLSWADLLLARHQLYLPTVAPLLGSDRLTGMVHITGGGLTENIPRILPPGCQARIDRSTWQPLPVFRHLIERGNIEREEAHRVFNMGIGFVLLCREADAASVQEELRGSGAEPVVIGRVEAGTAGVCYGETV